MTGRGTGAYAVAVLLAITALTPTERVRAQEESTLVADLSESQIAITTGFSGADVLLFGATDGLGEVIVVVRGPTDTITVRRKERVAGIWINTSSLAFDGVPGYYRVAASQPLATLLPDNLRQTFQIGDANIAVTPLETRSPKVEKDFFDALVRNRQREQLYRAEPGDVSFLGNRLFRTRITLPSNVPTGRYSVEVFLVSQGVIVNRTTTPLEVVKSGFEERVYSFAHEQSAIYGLIAIAIALVAGWFAGYVFRKI